MNDLKIYVFNAGALIFSAFDTALPMLQILVLLVTLVYTVIQSYYKLKNEIKKK